MPDPVLPTTTKTFDPKDSNPCESCSNCCEYLSIELAAPYPVKDFNDVYWYVMRKDVWVYIDNDKDWYIQFNSPCEKLVNKRCSVYDNRPRICREYEPKSCDRYSAKVVREHLFKNEQDLFDYLSKHRPKMYVKLKSDLGLN